MLQKSLTTTSGVVRNTVNNINDNGKHHILQDKHNWNELVPDPNNWNKIAAIITLVMREGKEEPYKSVYKKNLNIAGEIVEGTYVKIGDIIKISDAWIK